MKAPAVAAFSLVEVVLALAVASFCLLVMAGLLSLGVSDNRGSIDQTGATEVLSAAISDLNATPRTSPPGLATNSVQFGIAIPANPVTTVPAASVSTLYFDGNGGWSTNMTGTSVYRLTVTPIVSSAPGTTSPARMASFLDLKVTWPASLAATNAPGKVETFVGLNRN